MKKSHIHADDPPTAGAPGDDPTAATAGAADRPGAAAEGGDTSGDGGSPRAGAPADAGVEQEIAALAAEVATQKDKYLRLYADYENFRKRVTRERQEAELRGMGLLVRGILDALDDLGRFAHLDPAGTDTKTVVDGVELVERKILKSLAGHGLEVVNPVGAPFDPTFHEALTTVPAADQSEDHLIAQVYQVGYVFNGMLLRPARVVVKQWQGGAAPGMAS
ncbi:MAG TPA: nucleotide exchange factor GrpE [Gemmatimonadaceae bacterium]|nr:nucleotide exchange factor GrpE [Gemmatimonadaceae bacterium]